MKRKQTNKKNNGDPWLSMGVGTGIFKFFHFIFLLA